MTKYRCRNCSYRFNSQSERPPKACPNCGETGHVSREETAEELLNSND